MEFSEGTGLWLNHLHRIKEARPRTNSASRCDSRPDGIFGKDSHLHVVELCRSTIVLSRRFGANSPRSAPFLDLRHTLPRNASAERTRLLV